MQRPVVGIRWSTSQVAILVYTSPIKNSCASILIQMLEYWPQVQRSVIPPCALHCRTSVTDRINLKQANGFYRSKGVSGRIPEGYTLLEQRFWRGIIRSNRVWSGQHGVQLHEWVRDGWTYHAKGIWVTPTGDSTSDESGNYPVMTLFGSTNLNSRSANLDTELAFVMLLPESEGTLPLRRSLREEAENLRLYASPWLGGERKVRVGTKALVGMVGGML